MARSKQLVGAIKSQLRQQGITYRQLAVALGLSESAVKQMFSSGNFSLQRLDAICDVLGTDISGVMDTVAKLENTVSQLSKEVESQLVNDSKLLLVAYCLVNHWRVEDILEIYQIDELEMIRLLAQLDGMKLLELQPNNRVRMLISANFQWQPHGPIENYFTSQVQSAFFNSQFSDDGALRLVKNGFLSKRSQLEIQGRLQAIDRLFDEKLTEERKLPLKERRGVTMILAIRDWQFAAFKSLEK